MTQDSQGAPAPVADVEIDAGGSLEVLDPTGHFEVRWGKKKSEVDSAEKTFKDLLSKGYTAYRKTWAGRKGKQVDTFDPQEGVYAFDPPEEDAKPSKPNDLAAKGEPVDEPEHEQTKEFDPKADTTMVPPLRGG